MADSSSEYVKVLEELYEQAVKSDLSPVTLERYGGVIRLAGRDADKIRYDDAGIAGFIGFRRDPFAVERAARDRWQVHFSAIREIAQRQKMSETRAAQLYVQTLLGEKGAPSLEGLKTLTARQMGPLGWLPKWQYDAEVAIAIFQEQQEIAADPILMTIAGVTAMATREPSAPGGEPEDNWARGFEVAGRFSPLVDAAGAYADARGSTYHPEPPERPSITITERGHPGYRR
jgi:hypothetical protein